MSRTTLKIQPIDRAALRTIRSSLNGDLAMIDSARARSNQATSLRLTAIRARLIQTRVAIAELINDTEPVKES